MTREQLKAALRQPYQRTHWMITLAEFLPAVEWFAQAQTVSEVPVGVEAIVHLGKAPLAGGRALAVLEVRTGAGIDLPRNRVALRRLVAKYIDQATYHGVLAVFQSADDDKPNFRLTLAARESVFGDDGQLNKQETAPRRYSFMLGPGEPCTTAAERLQALADKGKAATLADVVDAFSVERLNKEFFKRYKEHYQRFVDHLLAIDTPQRIFGVTRNKDADEDDRALKPVRDFAKKLLGRVVFLHFLQKKGWLGCPAGADDWTGGNPDFLAHLFDTAPDKNRFYSTRLVPLFFHALNRCDRTGDLFAPTGTRVPYLNGGLFEEDLPRATHALDFPAALFEGLLGFLAEYNFTIDENDPEDHEIGIDPEMLGHVFENLLEDNKDKGAYYTPKAIVQYMCQQSLLHYLQSHLGDHGELVTLVRDKDPGEATDKKNWVRQNAKEIERLLDEVKICDPAIGSGAFPIGLLQEIYWIKLTLDWTLDRAETKRRIIQQSIYGVDIDAGAVEIARLRFWLALIVEEDQPSPLPNLDYKIMQGDSLLESFEGIALDKLFQHTEAGKPFAGQATFGFDTPGTQLILAEQQRVDFIALIAGYFAESDPAAKQALHGQIDAWVLTHIDDSIQAQVGRIKGELQQLRAEIKHKQRRAPAWKPPARTAKRIVQQEAELKLCAERGQKLKALEGKPERPYFLWHVYFQDVFARGGFDIVIGNPPYVDSERMVSEMPLYRITLAGRFTSAKGNWDLYIPFWQRAVQLKRVGGVACLLTPNKWLSISYARELRSQIGKKIIDIADFSRYRAFDAVGVFPVAVTVGEKAPDEICCLRFGNGFLESQFFLNREKLIQLDNFGLALSNKALQLIKLIDRGEPLSDLASIEEAFTVSEAYKLKEIVFDLPLNKSDAGTLRLLTTGGIEPFQTKWGIKQTTYLKGKYLRPVVTTTDLDFCFPKRKKKAVEAKIVIAGIRHFEAFYDAKGQYLPSKSTVVVRDAKKSLSFLASVLNSSAVKFFLKEAYGSLAMDGGVNYSPANVSQVPIPRCNEEAERSLEELSSQAAIATEEEMPHILERVDEIVFDGFGLSNDDVTAILDSLGQVPLKRTLVSRILPSLLTRAAYFSLGDLEAELVRSGIEPLRETLLRYLFEVVGNGFVHDAGRGWYSRLAEPFVLDTKPLGSLLRQVKNDFPLLDVSAWSTAQINPYAQHLLSTHTAFLYADSDALPSVSEKLEDRGWKVYLNPTPSEAERTFRPAEKTVVLRPALSKQPEGESGAAPIEKLLVDLLAEASRLRLMDESEAQTVIANVAQTGRIPVAALLGYALRRGLEISYFNESINSKSGEELDLVDQK